MPTKKEKKKEKKKEENHEFPYCTSMSKYSCKFHKSGCFHVGNIYRDNRGYYDDRQAAIISGEKKDKEPCLHCKP